MRRILYVDGFNFYYGVTAYWRREKNLAGLGWCNFRALVQRHFPDDGELIVKYFTAPVTQNVETRDHRPGEHARYSEWRRALRTVKDVVVIEGFYLPDYKENPDAPAKARKEKQTDTNVALEMVMDACGPAQTKPEHVFILCSDYDLMPAIFALQERVRDPPRLSVLLPSDSKKQDWEVAYEKTRRALRKCHCADKQSRAPSKPLEEVKVLDEAILASSLLGYSLRDSNGEFKCPHYWKLSPAYLELECRKHEWRPDLPSPDQATSSK
jgi:hypothetical protein